MKGESVSTEKCLAIHYFTSCNVNHYNSISLTTYPYIRVTLVLHEANLCIGDLDLVLENDPGNRFIAGRGGKGTFVSVVFDFLFGVFC